MLQLGPYSAWVAFDGCDRRTYATEVSQCGRCVSGWIASEREKKFSVNWHNALRDIPLEGVVSIDGVVCSTHVMLDKSTRPLAPDEISISYARSSDFTRRDFVFSTIQVMDEDEYLHTVDNRYTFGVIELELWRLAVSDVTARQPLRHQYGKPSLGPQMLHERSLKGGSHHVQFGDEYISRPSTVDLVTGTRIDERPFVKFTFNYRSMGMIFEVLHNDELFLMHALFLQDMLIAKGIAPGRMEQKMLRQEEMQAEIQHLEVRCCDFRSLSDY
ncbi:hypothetical protein IW261DRAFT_1333583 [Armillaria novae-zelandiae]|uniref:DUF7918 domain-containing protein n=1 Tax=Armillaria novae-zelandiae TaxID=153914 RepID=A0AA39PED8_9AGAR|nr:hypothetical protein IW261DRAFT_1333583 [Armillaria novae-zelandiae]